MSNIAVPSSRELLDSLVCGLPSYKRDTWLFGMLNCFIDDSGSDPKSTHRGPVFVLAGYVSTVERWKTFSDEWEMALKSGPKTLEYFKSTEAESRKRGQFDGWSTQERDAKLEELADVLIRNAMFGISAVLSWESYTSVQSEYPAHYLNPYALLYHAAISITVRRMRRLQIEDKIEFVFDEQGRDGVRASESYRLAKDDLPKDIRKYVSGLPIHRADSDFPPLQAADMAAWQVRRCFYENEQHINDISQYKFRAMLEKLNVVPHVSEIFDLNSLDAIYGHVKKRFPDGFQN